MVGHGCHEATIIIHRTAVMLLTRSMDSYASHNKCGCLARTKSACDEACRDDRLLRYAAVVDRISQALYNSRSGHKCHGGSMAVGQVAAQHRAADGDAHQVDPRLQ